MHIAKNFVRPNACCLFLAETLTKSLGVSIPGWENREHLLQIVPEMVQQSSLHSGRI